MNSVRTGDGSDDSIRFKPMERLKVYLFGATVLFASFGMGEAVYRLLFLEFDGITDRIPVEVLFGLVFAWLATKFVGGIYKSQREEHKAQIHLGSKSSNTRRSGRNHSLGPPLEEPTIDQGNPRRSR